jgi:hypothetical protein
LLCIRWGFDKIFTLGNAVHFVTFSLSSFTDCLQELLQLRGKVQGWYHKRLFPRPFSMEISMQVHRNTTEIAIFGNRNANWIFH